MADSAPRHPEPAGADPDTTREPELTADRLRDIFHLAPIGIGVVDAHGHTIHTNDALGAMLGYHPEEFARLHFNDFTHPEDVARNAQLFEELMAGARERFELDKRFRAADGSTVWGRLIVSAIREPGREPLAIGMLEDITERRLLQDQLEAAEATFRLLVEQVPAVVYVANADPAVPWRYVSPQIDTLLGVSPGAWLVAPGRWREHVVADDLGSVLDATRELLGRDHGATMTLHYRMRRSDGRRIWVRDEMVLHLDEGAPVLRGVLVDVTREKELEARLEYQAFHDPLTGLANRELFVDRLAHRLAHRRPDERSGAVLFIDLDDFKQVNDRLGHGVGDALLCSVADRLRNSVRPADTVSRLGGDEFAVLVESLDDPNDLAAVAGRVHAAIGSPHHLEGHELRISASIGATDLGVAVDVGSVLRNADLAMYRAKEQGKGRVATYDPGLRHEADERGDLRRSLPAARERGELDLLLQPIVDLHTGEVRSVQAVPTWLHPVVGRVDAATFLPIAAELGLSEELGQWLLERAAAWLADARQRGTDPGVQVVVEAVARQVHGPAFPEEVVRLLARHGLEPGAMIVVVPERTLVAEPVRATMQSLQDIGVGTAIGDYGTGYASLAPLSDGSVDVVRLDGRLVADLDVDGGARLPRALLQLASVLGVQVCAVDVATDAQRDTLREMGCALGQGRAFGAPGPHASVEATLLGTTARHAGAG